MYIINAYGVIHSIPDDWDIPKGSKKATDEEVSKWEAADQAQAATNLAAAQADARQRAEQAALAQGKAATPTEPEKVPPPTPPVTKAKDK